METRCLTPTSAPALRGFRPRVFRLAAGEVCRLPSTETLECLNGRCWVTVSGDTTDYLLTAGEILRGRRHSVVVQALEEASVRV